MSARTPSPSHLLVCWIALATFATNDLVIPVVAGAQVQETSSQKVTIPVGTVVDLTFDSAVTPETAVVGQSITLKVATDVKIGGKTVIAGGSTALGEVVQSVKAGAVGKEAQIGVSIKHVTAVDGTVVPLSGTKVVSGESHQTSSIVITVLCCILGLLQKGGKAEIPAGSMLRATVAAPIDVQVN